MKSTEIIQPTPISAPIAHEGLKFNIPENATGSELASIAEGFPEITMKALDNGGLPPRGQDCNGMFYLSTDQKVYLQNGGLITFDPSVAETIGGYPKGAILDYINESGMYGKVRSLIEDNLNNFVSNPDLIDNTNWEYVEFNSNALGYLPLTGGTLTGDLIFDQPDWSTILINAAKPSPTGTANVYKNLRFQDKETGESIGGIQLRRCPNGEEGVGLLVKHTNSDTYSRIDLLAKPDGTVTTYAPASDAANSIVTTQSIRKTANGYVKLGNGMILQWGRSANFTKAGQTQTITLPTAFNNTNYRVICSWFGETNVDDNPITKSFTTTTFQIHASTIGSNDGTWALGATWFAIGF